LATIWPKRELEAGDEYRLSFDLNPKAPGGYRLPLGPLMLSPVAASKTAPDSRT